MVAIVKGSVSRSIYFEVLDSASTTGGRKTGIAFNAAGLTAYYSRNGAAATAIILVTQTAAGAYSSGGWVEVDATNMPGVYRLDIPNAAIAGGADSVVVTVKGAAGMVQVSKEIQLTSADLQDATALGLTRLDAAITTRATPAQILTTPANLLATDASGRVTVGSIVNGAIAAATFAAGALDAVWSTAARTLTAFGFSVTVGTNNDKTGYSLANASIVAATFAAGALDAVWSVATRTLTAFGFNVTVGTNNDKTGYTASTVSDKTGYSLAVAPPTAAAISTQVWTEPVPGTFPAGSAGAKLNAAGAAGDPWTTVVPGAYAVGTAGNKLGNLGSASGSGALDVLVTVTSGGQPVDGALVWITTDAAGVNIVASNTTLTNGTCHVFLDTGTYYRWAQRGGVNFANGVSFTI